MSSAMRLYSCVWKHGHGRRCHRYDKCNSYMSYLSFSFLPPNDITNGVMLCQTHPTRTMLRGTASAAAAACKTRDCEPMVVPFQQERRRVAPFPFCNFHSNFNPILVSKQEQQQAQQQRHSHVPYPPIKRCFATQTKPKHKTHNSASTAKHSGKNHAQQSVSQNQPPINEHLIRMLLEKTQSSADDIQIRLIMDQGRDEKPLIEIMSLTEAIRVSGKMGLDLVGIQLDRQEIPVVKCVNYQKFLYQQNKKGSSGGSGGSGSGSQGGGGNKTTKQFTFKAGIDHDDLERKAKNMVGYLVKGHACQVTITSNRRNLQSDSDVIMTTLERLRVIVGGDGNPQGSIKTNEWGNRGTVLFQPVSRKN